MKTTFSLTHPTPLAELATSLRIGQLDLIDYIEQLCDRIDAVEPQIQALIPEQDRRSRLLTDARELLVRYPSEATRPALFGIPVGVKDIFHADGFETQAGSQLPPSVLIGNEAASVARLKEAGALLLGKTITTEFAYFEPGPTRNPHDLAHTPGGSSSGSAAAVAAGIAPLALGTQTIGSVIRPAAFCGIVGYKPTYNRIDPNGLLFFSRSVDHVGVFTQDTAGMVVAASVLCEDWRHTRVDAKPVLGIPEGPYLEQAEGEALRAFSEQIVHLQEMGFDIVRVPALLNIEKINLAHQRLIAYEFALEHAAWFSEYKTLYRPRTAALIREGMEIDGDELTDIRAGQATYLDEIEHVMDVHDIDLWICPAATGPAPEGIDSTGDPIMNLPWTHFGMPAVTVPAGFAANGLPLGLQLVGHWMADEKLLGMAQQVEAAFSQI